VSGCPQLSLKYLLQPSVNPYKASRRTGENASATRKPGIVEDRMVLIAVHANRF
jgi:hypothetical protein